MRRSIDFIADQYDGITRITQCRVVDHSNMLGKQNLEHDAILAATRAGDVDAAVQLMTNHIQDATERARNELKLDASSVK